MGYHTTMYLTTRDISRLLPKIDIRGAEECWPWTASRNHAGYGKFALGGRGKGWQPAPRVVYAVFYNRAPENMVCHTCDHPWCCNPAHLYDGLPRQNTADITERGRWNRGPGWMQGVKNGRAKLTEAAVLAIIGAPKGHGANIALAKRFGVSVTTVEQVRSGRTWSHVSR